MKLAWLPLSLALCLGTPLRAEPDVSPEAAEDARILVENAIAVARRTLVAQGDFHPFAFFMDPEGRIQRVTPKADAALPAPDALLALLQETFRARAAAGECRAVAVVADVVIALPDGARSDALQLGIEHREGYCSDLFHPYERRADGTLHFGEPIARARRGAVFPGCGSGKE